MSSVYEEDHTAAHLNVNREGSHPSLDITPDWTNPVRTRGGVISSHSFSRTRRINTEEKAKVVTAVCGTEFIQFLPR